MGKEALFYAALGQGETDRAIRTAQEMKKKGLSTVWVDYLAKRAHRDDGRADFL